MRVRVCAGLSLVLVSALCVAQSPPVLTEAEFLSALDGDHPAIREAATAVALAEAEVLAAKRLENPVLGVVREGPLGSSEQTDVLISWQPPDRGRSATIAARERAVEAARAHSQFLRLDRRLAMRAVYADWALAHDRVRRLASQMDRVATLAAREAARATHGEVSGLDAHRLQLALVALRSQAALATSDRDRARGQAVAWFPDLPPDAEPVLPPLPPLPASSVSTAEIEAARAAIDIAQLTRDAAGRFVRLPEVLIGWQHQDSGQAVNEGPIAGLSWSIPLFDRKKAARDAADAHLARSQARLDLVERATQASRQAATARYAGFQAFLSEGAETLAQNERMLDGAQAAFVDGELGLTEFLDTLRSIGDAELATLAVHEAALSTHRDLERLAGMATVTPSIPDPSATTFTQVDNR